MTRAPVPFDPLRPPKPPHCVPPGSERQDGGEPSHTRRFLQRVLPESARFAHQMAIDLVRQVEYLTWSTRAEAFDTYFLRQAEAMLRPKGLTELVNGAGGPELPERRELEERASRFAGWSRAMVTAVLLELDERAEVTNADQALTYLIGRDLVFAKAAAQWTAVHGMEPLGVVLRRLPGYALVLLASNPNDTVERFMARDAFWSAVMGSR
jgi:hypothetical protein